MKLIIVTDKKQTNRNKRLYCSHINELLVSNDRVDFMYLLCTVYIGCFSITKVNSTSFYDLNLFFYCFVFVKNYIKRSCF